ncbi:MAG: GNAT family N-acetyltransferase [Ktedonobacterales bacterium]
MTDTHMAIRLQPMTDDEYNTWSEVMWEEYARDRAKAGNTPLEEERAEASRQQADLLPNGLHTDHHFFWTVVDASDTQAGDVGKLWVFHNVAKQQAFIYDIEMNPEQRGKGYGRATLAALEDQMRTRGITRICLNVFGYNAVARHLYENVGYQEVAIFMQKDI